MCTVSQLSGTVPATMGKSLGIPLGIYTLPTAIYMYTYTAIHVLNHVVHVHACLVVDLYRRLELSQLCCLGSSVGRASAKMLKVVGSSPTLVSNLSLYIFPLSFLKCLSIYRVHSHNTFVCTESCSTYT